jgi:hypothetical protein
MNKAQEVLEKLEKSFAFQGNYVEVFVNPDSREFRDAIMGSDYGEIRFLADAKKKKVYIWSAEKALHLFVAKQLNISTYAPHILAGEASAFAPGRKPYMTGSFALGGPDREKILKNNWTWLEKYIDVKDFLKKEPL